MKRALVSFLVGLWVSCAQANVPCTVPFNLQNNTTADATQVMANYNAILTCLGSAAAAGANSDITSLLGLTTPIGYTAGGSSVYIGGTSTGTANAQVVATPLPNGFSLTAGKQIIFVAGNTNTGATQLNVNGLGLVNVYRASPSGPQALTGGEIVTGNLVQAIYDGTQFELLTLAGPVGGYGPLTNIASAATVDLGTIGSHNANITGVAAITSFGSSASTTYPRYQIQFASSLTLTYNGTSLLTPGAANIVTAAGDVAELMYLGSGNWQVINYMKANGTAVVNPTPLCGFNGLSMTNNVGTPNTNVDISADSFVLINPTGNVPIYGINASVTVNTTTGTGGTSTANGMDGSAPGNNNFIHFYLISNGTTVAGLGSASSSAPSMPSGYTYRCRIGAMKTNGAGNFYGTKQLGRWVQYISGGNGLTGIPNLAVNAQGSNCTTATPTWQAITVRATTGAFPVVFPPTAIRAAITMNPGNNAQGPASTLLSTNNAAGGFVSNLVPPAAAVGVTGANDIKVVTTDIMLESNAVYICGTGNGSSWFALGWTEAGNVN